MKRYIVAITGASGVIYGVRFVQTLLSMNHEVHLVLSDAACIVLEQELGWDAKRLSQLDLQAYFPGKNLVAYHNSNIAAPIASGSFQTDGMVIIPCTMSTLAAVAHGMSDDLIERAADVMLKERRRLVLVPRETPLSAIHLRNMLSLADMGAHIVPAMPGFYHRPQSLGDLVDFMLGKVLDVMEIPNQSFQRYEGR